MAVRAARVLCVVLAGFLTVPALAVAAPTDTGDASSDAGSPGANSSTADGRDPLSAERLAASDRGSRVLDEAPGLIASITWDTTQRVELTDPTTGTSRDLWSAPASTPTSSTYIRDIEWRPGGTSLTLLTETINSVGTGTYDYRLIDVRVVSKAETLLYQFSSAAEAWQDVHGFSWLPDGRRAVITRREGADMPSRLLLLDTETDTLSPLSQPGGWQWGAEVSPTGEWTVVSGDPPGAGTQWGLWLRNRDGTTQRTLFEDVNWWWWGGWSGWGYWGWNGTETSTAWSPDGTQLVVPRANAELRAASLWTYDIATRDLEELVRAPAGRSLHDPAWSPDGRYLAYNSYRFDATDDPFTTVVRDLRTGETVTIENRQTYWSRWDLEWQPVATCTVTDERNRTDAAGTLFVTVGDWMASGCLGGTGRLRSTETDVMLNGMTLTPKAGSTIRIDTTAKRLTSTGPVSVRLVGRDGGLPVGPIKLFEGRLNWDLSKSTVTFDIEHLFDAPLVGEKLVVRAVSPGRGTIDASIGVPFFLGRSTIPLDRIELTNTRGLGAAAFRWEAARDPSITGLIPLTGTVVEYDPRTQKWMVRATIDGNGSKPSMSFDHDKGVLRSARFGIDSMSLIGLATVRDVAVSYQRTDKAGGAVIERYSFTARIPSGSSTDSLSGFLEYRDGALQEFRAEADLAKLLQIVQVRDFGLQWTREDGWSGQGRLVAGDPAVGSAADISLQLISQSGRIVGGSLRAPIIRLGAPGSASLQIEDLQVSYTLAGGPTGQDRDIWQGQMRLRLPGPDSPAIGGSVTFVQGKLTRARAEASDVRIGPGFILRQIAADVELDPLTLTGTATAQVGPDLPGAPPAKVVGELSFKKGASATASDRYAISGTVTIGNASLADAKVVYLTSGRTSIEGALRWDIPGLGLTGARVVGYADEDELVLTGRVRIGFGDGRLDGRVLITKEGLTACVDLPGVDTRAGFGYRWDGTLTRFSAACDLGRLDVLDTTGARSRSGDISFTVPRSTDAFAVAVSGQGGAPVLTLTGPGGTRVSTSPTGDGILDGRALRWSDPRNGISYVTLIDPAAGSWTITAEPGSPAIGTVRVARPLPDANVTGSIAGAGRSRSLTYRITPIAGQTVTFVERWDGGSAVLGDASGDTGTLRFAPAPGAGGRRTVVAVVSQNGLPRSEVTVTSYSTTAVRERCTPQRRCTTTITLATQTQGNLLYAGGTVRPARPGGSVLLQLFRTKSGPDELVFTLPTVVAADGRYNDYLVTTKAQSCTLVATYLGDAGYRPHTTSRPVRC